MQNKFKIGDRARVIRDVPCCRRLTGRVGVIDILYTRYVHLEFGTRDDGDNYDLGLFALEEVELVIDNALQRLKKRYAKEII